MTKQIGDLSQALPNTHNFVPYGRQFIDEDDIQAVVDVLRSNMLTTGPVVPEFERACAAFCGVQDAVVVSSGTAALHAAMHAIGISSGDEVIVPAITFAASANCVVYMGGRPVFVDVDADTLLIDPIQVASMITAKTKAIVAVDYAGQPCDYDALYEIASNHGIPIVDDACHALGSTYKGRQTGSLADLNVFSFHPVKHITTGEGGMITTNDDELAKRLRIFRNHGITTDHHQRAGQGSWFYEMVDLGYNYRISDFQCALGMSQLRKLSQWIDRRQMIARQYDNAFKDFRGIFPLKVSDHVSHAYHLYVIRIGEEIGLKRADVFDQMRKANIGVNVHYIPVHLHPYYQKQFGTYKGQCPNAETAYEKILTLPLFSSMSDDDVHYVIDTLSKILCS